MKLKLTVRLFLTFLLAVMLSHCATESQMKAAFEPTFEQFDLPYQTFVINNEMGATLELANGTIITIPANSFTDVDGNVISGDVTLNYREMHDLEDIIISGIPMHFAENNESGHLKTAGMIELKGKAANGEDIKIADGKNIAFEMPSKVDEKGVDFYRLDDNTGEWIKEGKQTETPDENYARLKDSLEKYSQVKQPFKPKKYNSSTPVVQFKSLNRMGNLQSINKAVWQYAGTAEAENPFNNEDFVNDNYKIVRNELIDKELNILEVEMVFKEKKRSENSGSDTMRVGKPKTLITWFAPVFSNSEFEKAMNDYADKEAVFLEAQKRAMEYQKLVDQTARVVRSFTINNFSVYNCDIFMKYASEEVPLEIVSNDEKYTGQAKMFAIYGSGKTKSILPFDFVGSKPNNFRIIENQNVVLLAVLPGDEAVKIDNEAIAKMLTSEGKVVINIANAKLIGNPEDLSNLTASL
ncbi:hypothetical protein GC194_04325 [bacterium]|nr:hypothetical protein [bacterium]